MIAPLLLLILLGFGYLMVRLHLMAQGYAALRRRVALLEARMADQGTGEAAVIPMRRAAP